MENKKLSFADYVAQLDDDDVLSVVECVLFTTIPNLSQTVSNYENILEQYKLAHRHEDCQFVYQQLLIAKNSLSLVVTQRDYLIDEVNKRNLLDKWSAIVEERHSDKEVKDEA